MNQSPWLDGVKEVQFAIFSIIAYVFRNKTLIIDFFSNVKPLIVGGRNRVWTSFVSHANKREHAVYPTWKTR
jgi:hypothetical protein